MADPQAYQRLKDVCGIRNRLWTRTPERLRPLMALAHQEAVARQHRPLFLALLAAERARQAGQSSGRIREKALSRLARALTRLRFCRDYSLLPGQACIFVTAHQGFTLSVRNADGSTDMEARRRLLGIITAALSEMEAGTPDQAATIRERSRIILARMLPGRNETKTAEGTGDPLGEAVQALGPLLPGLPLLIRLFRMAKELTNGNTTTQARELLAGGARAAVQASVVAALSALRYGADLAGPAATVVGMGLDRLAANQRSLESLEKGTAALLPLHLHYSVQQKKTIVDAAAETESERAALRALILPADADEST